MRYVIFPVVLALLCAAGCSESPKAQAVSIDAVPEAVMARAKEKLPEITFDQALKRADGSFEVRGKDKHGKIRDIDLTATGDVISIE